MNDKEILTNAFGDADKNEIRMLALSPIVRGHEDAGKELSRTGLLKTMRVTLSRGNRAHFNGEAFPCEVLEGYPRSELYWGGNAVVIKVPASRSAADISLMLFGEPGKEYIVYDHQTRKYYLDGKEWQKPTEQPTAPSP